MTTEQDTWENESLPAYTTKKSLVFSVKISPFPDELFSSWFTRLVHANLTTITSILWQLHYRLNENDLDLILKQDILELFSQKIGLPVADLTEFTLLPKLNQINQISNDLTLKPQNKSKSSRIESLWFTDWNANLKRYKNGIRFCPLCLKSDQIPFFRKEWRLGYNPICFKHRCYLLSSCPSCGSAIAYYHLKWDKPLNECFHCGANLADANVEYLPKSDSICDQIGQFLSNSQLSEIDKVLRLIWFLSNHCGLCDLGFCQHPLLNDKDLIKDWQTYSSKANKLPLFRNLKYLYLILGSAIQLLEDSNRFDSFMKNHLTSSEMIFSKKPFHCTQDACSFSTTDYIVMLIHQLKHAHHDFACTICFQSFTTMIELENHKKVHGKGKQSCNLCNISFQNAEQLSKHMEFHAIGRIFLCNDCGRIFSTKGMLNIHSRSNSGDRPYICNVCGKEFVSQNGLSLHSRTHTNERPYTCEICGQKFSQHIALSNHKRTHTGERPYQCKYCEKSFTQNGGLIAHLRIHTGEKPFLCQICGERFSEQGVLKNHSRIHSGERPFKCEICGETFKTRGPCNRHKHMHGNSNQKSFQCEYCQKTYSRQDHLDRHIKSAHTNP